jgi:hypothetical protein
VQSNGTRAAWEDPVDWVRASCPWSDTMSFDWSVLQRIRPEDVGCDGMSSSNVMTSSCIGRNVTSARTGSAPDNVDPLVNYFWTSKLKLSTFRWKLCGQISSKYDSYFRHIRYVLFF